MKKLICLITSAFIGITSLFAFGLEAQLSAGTQIAEKIGLTFGRGNNLTMGTGLKMTQTRDEFTGLYFNLDYMLPCFSNTGKFAAGLVFGSEVAFGMAHPYVTSYDGYGTTTSYYEDYSTFTVNLSPYLGLGMQMKDFSFLLTANADFRSSLPSYWAFTAGLTVRYNFSKSAPLEGILDSEEPDYQFRGNLDLLYD